MPLDSTDGPRKWANVLAALGRGNDSMLAHITPREASILRALGGSGGVNPDTGLVEFDDGGGGGGGGGYAAAVPPTGGQAAGPLIPGFSFDPQSGNYSNASGGFATPQQAIDPNTSQGIATAISSQYGSGFDNVTPIDPNTYSQMQSQAAGITASDQGGGISVPVGQVGSPFNATPGNPYYSTNDQGYATFTPQGQSAWDQWLQQQQTSVTENAAKNAGGLSGMLANPVTGIPLTLGLPLAIGGLAALGGAEAAVGVGTDLGAGAGLPTSALTSQSALDAAMAADLPSAGAGAATGAGAGPFGTAAGDFAGASSAIGGDLTGAAFPAVSDATTGLATFSPDAGAATGGALDATGGLGNFAGIDATSLNLGAPASDFASSFAPAASTFTDPAVAASPLDGLGGVSAGGGFASTAPGGDIFLGATDTGAAASDVTAADLASSDTWDLSGAAAGAGGGSSSFLSDPLSWLTNAAGKAFSNNPLGVLLSAGGLGLNLLQGNKGISSYPGGSQLQGTAAALGAQGQSLINQANTGQLPPADQAALTAEQQAAAGLTGQSASLLNQVSSGQLPPADAAAIAQQQQSATALGQQSATLENYLNTGTLPPALQAQIKQSVASAKATIRSRYASMGMSGSSSEASDLANADQAGVQSAASIQQQLYSTGVSEATTAANIQGNIASETGSITQQLLSGGLSTATSAASQLQNIAAQTDQITQNLISTGVSESGISADLYSQILKIAMQQDAGLGQAIGNLAASLSKPTITLNTSTAHA